MRDISNSDDIIDLRDVIARFEELETERGDLAEAIEEARVASYAGEITLAERGTHTEALAAWDEENGAEFESLRKLLEECKGYGGDEQWRGDWYPVTLIRDSYFKDYAMELADDIGAINTEIGWPNNCIDWDKAARELRMDYSTAEFDGVTYWYR